MTSALAAIALQGGIALLLVMSFPIVRRLTEEKETILTLPPLRRAAPRPAIVIDGRPHPALRPPTLPPAPLAPPLAPALPPAPQAAPKPAPDKALLQELGRSLADCRPEKYNDLSASARAACPPPAPGARLPPSNMVDLHPPSGVKDEARWQAEMARKNAPPDAGVSTDVGIGVVISDPLCKLAWLMLGGGFHCGAPPAHHDATDAQVDAAVAAANARKRALSETSVLMSGAKTGETNAKDGNSGGAGAAAGGAAISPGR